MYRFGNYRDWGGQVLKCRQKSTKQYGKKVTGKGRVRSELTLFSFIYLFFDYRHALRARKV